MELTNTPFVNNKYELFYRKNGYIPRMFNPYNRADISKNNICPTLSTQCGSLTSSATVLIIDNYKENK